MHPFNGSKVPSSEQCYNLLKRYAVPDNIIEHSEVVCRVATFLAERLNDGGENLSLAAIKAAALLHDITKMEGIKSRQDHAETGRRLLAELGFSWIGDIVGEHIRLQGGREHKQIREQEIINYADKRVRHTQIVTLKERFADLRKRYGLNGLDNDAVARITALEERTYALERKIFSRLDFAPEELLQRMEMD